jgi:hypothetical protein
MRHISSTLIAFCFLIATGGNVYAEMTVVELGDGWNGIAKQTDPFDSSIVDVFQVSKGNFKLRCGDLNMAV